MLEKVLKNNNELRFWVVAVCLGLLLFGAVKASAATVTLSAAPAANMVAVGQSVSYTINLNRDNYTDKVTLSATNLPAGVVATLTPNPAAGTSSVLKLQTATSTPLGTFNINVKGTAAGVLIDPLAVTLTTVAKAVAITPNPQSQSIVAGQTTYYDIKIARYGFKGDVALAAENLPVGVTAVFQPQTTSGNTSRMWLYSNGLPPFQQDYQIAIVAKSLDFPEIHYVTAAKLKVNCDIVWTYQGFAENQGLPDFATAVAKDAAGNVYLAGHLITPSTNSTEVWAAKFNAAGTRQWLRNLTLTGATGLEKRARAIAVDAAGNVFVAGYTQTGTTSVNYDAFIVKLDATGNQLNNTKVGNNPDEDGTRAMELGFDASGRVVLTSVMNFRTQQVSNQNTGRFFSSGTYNLSRFTFNATLGNIGSTALLTNETGTPNDLTVAPDGSIYVVGKDVNLSASANFPFVRKLASGGQAIWSYTYNSPDFFATRVAVNTLGDVFVGGGTEFDATLDQDAWIARNNSTTGALVWQRVEKSPDREDFGDLVADASGNVVYAGMTTGNLAATNPDRPIKTDGWLAKRAPDGSLVFMRQFAVADKDEFSAITLDSTGKAVIVGNTVNFNNVNYGYEDVFLMKFSLSGNLLVPSITSLNPSNVAGGTQFTINGSNLSGIEGVYFNGQPIPFTIVSATQITATAPAVTGSTTGNITLSIACQQVNSPVQLTVTP